MPARRTRVFKASLNPRQRQHSQAMLLSTATCYSEESKRISEIYVKTNVREHHNITKIEEDVLRSNYRIIMTRRTWKNELLAVGQRLVDDRLDRDSDSRIEEGPSNGKDSEGPEKSPSPIIRRHISVKIRYSKQKYSFTNSDGAVAVFIGRRAGCDVTLKLELKTSLLECSRLHAVLFILEAGEAIIADVGSYHGIRVDSTNIKHRPVLSSLPGTRRLLRFQEGDRIVLMMGAEKLSVSIESKMDIATKQRAGGLVNFAGTQGANLQRLIGSMKCVTLKECAHSNASGEE